MRRSLIMLLFLTPWIGTAQDSLSVIATKWADTFVEWDIYPQPDSEDPVGHVMMRWQAQNDWTTWDYRIGETIGDISTRWRDRMDEWVIQSEGKRVAMKTRWPGDYSEWRITDDNKTYILAVDNPNRPEEWQLKYEDDITFQIYTEFEGDLRSWLIYQKGDHLPQATQMALIFAVLVSTVPKT